MIADTTKEVITKSQPAMPLIRHGLTEVSMARLCVACSVLVVLIVNACPYDLRQRRDGANLT